MATTYIERTQPTATYEERIKPESNYSGRVAVESNYEDRDPVTGVLTERLQCGHRYRWSELINTWLFYHVSWEFLNASRCTEYTSRDIPL